MKKFKLLSLLLIISLFAGVFAVPALALDDPVTNAQSVVLMDADSGEVLYQKSGDYRFAPNDLNMLMTALVTGDSLDRQDIRLDDVVSVPDNFLYNVPEGGNRIGLTAGENLTVEQLLYATTLAVCYGSANVLAQYVSGTYDGFVDAMNSKAAELGCTDTRFTNVNGVYDESQHTTTLDIAKIARAVFQSAQVMAAFETSSYTIPATAVYGDRSMTTYNALINSNDDRRYERAYAGLTATTSMGYTLVSAATYNNLDVIAVIVDCPEGTDRFAEAKNLFEWVFSNFGYRTLVSSTDTLDTLSVSMGNPGTVGVCASDSIQIIMPNDEEPSNLTLDISYQFEQEGTELRAPISVGEYLGDLTVSMNGEVQGTSRVVAATAVDISRLDYLRSQLDVLLQNQSVRKVITILLAALGVYLLLVVVYVIQRIVHLDSLRRARKARAADRAQQELDWLELPAGGDAGYLPDSGPSGERAPAGGGYDSPERPAEESDGQPEQDEPVDEPAGDEGGYYDDGSEPAEDEGEYYDDGSEPAGDEGGYYDDEGEPTGDEGGYYDDEGEPAGDEGGYYDDGSEPAGDEGGYYDDGSEPAGDEDEYYDDGGEYDEGEYDDGDYYDDGGNQDPPEKPKRRWWKR